MRKILLLLFASLACGSLRAQNNGAPFLITETMPTFQGGDLNTFRNWVNSRLRYPAEAQDNNIQGRVLIEFVVDTDGGLSDFKVLQAPDRSLSEEALRVIRQSPKWTPGKQRGQLVRVKYTLPVDFRLAAGGAAAANPQSAQKRPLTAEEAFLMDLPSPSQNQQETTVQRRFSSVPTFSDYAKEYVETRINEWQQKGRYEKTAEWQERVNTTTRDAKIRELAREAERAYIERYRKGIALNITIGDYDADNEVFLINTNLGALLVPVPLSRAEQFEKRWTDVQKSVKYCISNDYLALSEAQFKMPDGAVYKYSNQESVHFAETRIDYNFDPIELDIAPAQTPAKPQNISTTTLTAGHSDVDTNIPRAARSNDKTFAVIIANENYTRLAHVPFALNDGKMFGEYCRQTLGVPASNVRIYNDATYGVMIEAINDIRKIAAAYNGEIRVLFYYAGHGAPNESTQEAYLLPVDAFGVQSEVCYPLARLYNELGALPAESVTLFLDACFSGAARSGGMLASTRGVAIKPRAAEPEGKLIVFSAASQDETALPYTEKGHGLFTYFLLKKLQQSKGQTTYGELIDYIQTNVRQKSNVEYRKEQTPTLTPGAEVGNAWRQYRFVQP